MSGEAVLAPFVGFGEGPQKDGQAQRPGPSSTQEVDGTPQAASRDQASQEQVSVEAAAGPPSTPSLNTDGQTEAAGTDAAARSVAPQPPAPAAKAKKTPPGPPKTPPKPPPGNAALPSPHRAAAPGEDAFFPQGSSNRQLPQTTPAPQLRDEQANSLSNVPSGADAEPPLMKPSTKTEHAEHGQDASTPVSMSTQDWLQHLAKGASPVSAPGSPHRSSPVKGGVVAPGSPRFEVSQAHHKARVNALAALADAARAATPSSPPLQSRPGEVSPFAALQRIREQGSQEDVLDERPRPPLLKDFGVTHKSDRSLDLGGSPIAPEVEAPSRGRELPRASHTRSMSASGRMTSGRPSPPGKIDPHAAKVDKGSAIPGSPSARLLQAWATSPGTTASLRGGVDPTGIYWVGGETPGGGWKAVQPGEVPARLRDGGAQGQSAAAAAFDAKVQHITATYKPPAPEAGLKESIFGRPKLTPEELRRKQLLEFLYRIEQPARKQATVTHTPHSEKAVVIKSPSVGGMLQLNEVKGALGDTLAGATTSKYVLPPPSPPTPPQAPPLALAEKPKRFSALPASGVSRPTPTSRRLSMLMGRTAAQAPGQPSERELLGQPPPAAKLETPGPIRLSSVLAETSKSKLRAMRLSEERKLAQAVAEKKRRLGVLRKTSQRAGVRRHEKEVSLARAQLKRVMGLARRMGIVLHPMAQEVLALDPASFSLALLRAEQEATARAQLDAAVAADAQQAVDKGHQSSDSDSTTTMSGGHDTEASGRASHIRRAEQAAATAKHSASAAADAAQRAELAKTNPATVYLDAVAQCTAEVLEQLELLHAVPTFMVHDGTAVVSEEVDVDSVLEGGSVASQRTRGYSTAAASEPGSVRGRATSTVRRTTMSAQARNESLKRAVTEQQSDFDALKRRIASVKGQLRDAQLRKTQREAAWEAALPQEVVQARERVQRLHRILSSPHAVQQAIDAGAQSVLDRHKAAVAAAAKARGEPDHKDMLQDIRKWATDTMREQDEEVSAWLGRVSKDAEKAAAAALAALKAQVLRVRTMRDLRRDQCGALRTAITAWKGGHRVHWESLLPSLASQETTLDATSDSASCGAANTPAAHQTYLAKRAGSTGASGTNRYILAASGRNAYRGAGEALYTHPVPVLLASAPQVTDEALLKVQDLMDRVWAMQDMVGLPLHARVAWLGRVASAGHVFNLRLLDAWRQRARLVSALAHVSTAPLAGAAVSYKGGASADPSSLLLTPQLLGKVDTLQEELQTAGALQPLTGQKVQEALPDRCATTATDAARVAEDYSRAAALSRSLKESDADVSLEALYAAPKSTGLSAHSASRLRSRRGTYSAHADKKRKMFTHADMAGTFHLYDSKAEGPDGELSARAAELAATAPHDIATPLPTPSAEDVLVMHSTKDDVFKTTRPGVHSGLIIVSRDRGLDDNAPSETLAATVQRAAAQARHSAALIKDPAALLRTAGSSVSGRSRSLPRSLRRAAGGSTSAASQLRESQQRADARRAASVGRHLVQHGPGGATFEPSPGYLAWRRIAAGHGLTVPIPLPDVEDPEALGRTMRGVQGGVQPASSTPHAGARSHGAAEAAAARRIGGGTGGLYDTGHVSLAEGADDHVHITDAGAAGQHDPASVATSTLPTPQIRLRGSAAVRRASMAVLRKSAQALASPTPASPGGMSPAPTPGAPPTSSRRQSIAAMLLTSSNSSVVAAESGHDANSPHAGAASPALRSVSGRRVSVFSGAQAQQAASSAASVSSGPRHRRRQSIKIRTQDGGVHEVDAASVGGGSPSTPQWGRSRVVGGYMAPTAASAVRNQRNAAGEFLSARGMSIGATSARSSTRHGRKGSHRSSTAQADALDELEFQVAMRERQSAREQAAEARAVKQRGRKSFLSRSANAVFGAAEPSVEDITAGAAGRGGRAAQVSADVRSGRKSDAHSVSGRTMRSHSTGRASTVRRDTSDARSRRTGRTSGRASSAFTLRTSGTSRTGGGGRSDKARRGAAFDAHIARLNATAEAGDLDDIVRQRAQSESQQGTGTDAPPRAASPAKPQHRRRMSRVAWAQSAAAVSAGESTPPEVQAEAEAAPASNQRDPSTLPLSLYPGYTGGGRVGQVGDMSPRVLRHDRLRLRAAANHGGLPHDSPYYHDGVRAEEALPGLRRAPPNFQAKVKDHFWVAQQKRSRMRRRGREPEAGSLPEALDGEGVPEGKADVLAHGAELGGEASGTQAGEAVEPFTPRSDSEASEGAPPLELPPDEMEGVGLEGAPHATRKEHRPSWAYTWRGQEAAALAREDDMTVVELEQVTRSLRRELAEADAVRREVSLALREMQ